MRARRSPDDVVLIVNPNSSGGSTGKSWNELYAKMEKIFGSRIRVDFTKKQLSGTSIARNLLRKGYSSVVAVGGDGTINEVANGFFEEITGARGAGLKQINPDAVMGIIPCGTRNLIAKSLGLPLDVEECCKKIASGSRTKFDVIATYATDPDDGSPKPPRIFLNAAEMGFGAEVIDRSKKVRKRMKSRLVSTAAAILATMPVYESNPCIISTVGRKKTVNMTMGVAANGKFLAGDFIMAPEASMSDGLLDLVVLKDSGSLKMLDDLIYIKTGNFDKGNILHSKAKKVTIKPIESRMTVAIDGERAGVLPASFQVFPKALGIAV